MNAPRDLGPDFRSWMGDAPEPPEVLPARTLEQTRHTRQRRRWLWFLPGRKPTAGALDEPDDGPAPSDQPTVGITPGRVKGTITMFSATKLIAAASVLALSAGIASSGVLTTEPGTPAAGPVWTGDYFDSDEGLVAVSGSGRFGPSPGVVTGTVDHERSARQRRSRRPATSGCASRTRPVPLGQRHPDQRRMARGKATCGLNGPLPSHDPEPHGLAQRYRRLRGLELRRQLRGAR